MEPVSGAELIYASSEKVKAWGYEQATRGKGNTGIFKKGIHVKPEDLSPMLALGRWQVWSQWELSSHLDVAPHQTLTEGGEFLFS